MGVELAHKGGVRRWLSARKGARMNKHEELAWQVVEAAFIGFDTEAKQCAVRRILPILERAYPQGEPRDAEQIRVHAVLAFDTVYSDNFCLRCSHDPSNCECAEPVYMPPDWKLIPKLEKLKVAYGEQGEPQPIDTSKRSE